MPQLLKTTDELRLYYSRLSVQTEFASLASFVEAAEEKYVKPLIGETAFANMAEWYDGWDGTDTDPDDAKRKKLLAQIQRPLTYYALLEQMPSGVVDLGNEGTREGNTEGSAPVRQWTYNQLADHISDNADVFSESLLAFLEKNKADYGFWDDSDERKAARRLLIPNGAALANLVDVTQPHRFFNRFARIIKRIQTDLLPTYLGEELLTELLTDLEEGTTDAAQDKLIQKIAPYLAHAAMVEGLPEMVLQVTTQGIRVVNDNNGQQDRHQADPSQINAYITRHKNRAEQCLGNLLRFLMDNKADYPLWPVPVENTNSARMVEFSDNTDRTSFRM